jgi:uncharacterized membrane protein
MKIITDKEKVNFEKRLAKIEPKLHRNYVTIMEFLRPGKYTKSQLRDFKMRKSLNFHILADFEEIIKLIKE